MRAGIWGDCRGQNHVILEGPKRWMRALKNQRFGRAGEKTFFGSGWRLAVVVERETRGLIRALDRPHLVRSFLGRSFLVCWQVPSHLFENGPATQPDDESMISAGGQQKPTARPKIQTRCQ